MHISTNTMTYKLTNNSVPTTFTQILYCETNITNAFTYDSIIYTF